MSMFIVIFLGSLLEGLYEAYIDTKNEIEHYVGIRRFKRYLRKRRSGKRADYKTRAKYKIESMIDFITSE